MVARNPLHQSFLLGFLVPEMNLRFFFENRLSNAMVTTVSRNLHYRMG